MFLVIVLAAIANCASLLNIFLLVYIWMSPCRNKNHRIFIILICLPPIDDSYSAQWVEAETKKLERNWREKLISLQELLIISPEWLTLIWRCHINADRRRPMTNTIGSKHTTAVLCGRSEPSQSMAPNFIIGRCHRDDSWYFCGTCQRVVGDEVRFSRWWSPGKTNSSTSRQIFYGKIYRSHS